MGRQFFVNILVLIGVMLPQLAGALGLGNITPHSSLNQPLRAEIKLVQVRGLEQREILVSLAAQEHFDRYGVDRPYFLSDLNFEVDLQAVGGPIVIVTSRKPVREPYLNFILQAQWPSGKLLKEFTVLLDLPVYADTQSGTAVQGTTSQFAAQPEPEVSQAPAAEIAPEVEESAVMEHISLRENPRSSFTPEESASEAPPREELPSRNRSQTVAAPALAGSEDYTVRSGDTLWEIAARTRPDRAVSVQQTMLAIQRLNAEAFIDSNINLLKKGQVLRIPDRDEIVGVAPQRAVEEVAIQNQEWSSGGAEFSDVQLDATNVRESSSVAEASQEGRLKLTSPEESVDSLEGRASGGGESSSAALENELAITLEQMDMAGKESGELRSKIAALEEQIETADKLIAISNQELRAMELAAEMAASASEELATTEELVPTEASETLASSEQNEIVFPEPNELTASAEDEFVSAADEIAATYEQAEMGDQGDSAFATAGSETMTEEPVLADAESAPTEEEEQKPAEASAPVPTPAAPGKSIVTRIMDNILYIGIGVLALVILAFLFIRSRADDGFEDEDFLQDMNFEESASEFDVEQALTEEAENIENFAEEAVQEVTEDVVPAEAQTEDVGAEADIYIAYGKYDQAEEILLKSLENEPENTEIRLKLLEVYATQRDGDKFDNNLSLLHEMGAVDAVSRANQLRSGIPDLAPYGAGPVIRSFAADTPAQADDSLDFSLGVGQEEEGESEASLELELDEDLDFDLDTVSEEVEGGELDFDLGGDDLDLNDDDLVIDLDSGEENAQSLNDGDEQSPSALIEDDLAADIEPLEFDLGSGDTEVGGEELLDTNAEASTETAGHDLDFDLELSTDSADDFSEVADGALDFLEDSDDDSTLIAPAVTDEDVSAADDLGLEGTDLDLSSLDQELDALTGDGDLDFDGDLGLEDLGLEEDPLETEASSLNMEEPVIDFDADDASPEVAASQPEPNAELDQALADIPRSEMNFDLPEIDPEAADDDADLGFLSDSDETATKLDLARAYIDMGDAEGAKDIISEILSEGNEQQKTEASSLLQRLA